MTESATTFISNLLASATAKHAEAIAAVEARPIDIERCRAADKQLADAELLLIDVIDTLEDAGAVESVQLEGALSDLQHQRELLAEGLAKFDMAQAMAGQQQPSPWATPWPWISLALIGLIVLQVVA